MCPRAARRCSRRSSAAARAARSEDADLDLAVDALHGAVFYRLLLSGEPLDDDFADRLTQHTLAGLLA